MEAQGDTNHANFIVPVEDLSMGTLIALVDRLRMTETPNQFLCREIELDEAYLQADAEFRIARDEGAEGEKFERAKFIRSLVINAHDLLGESDIQATVQALNQVIEIKIGL